MLRPAPNPLAPERRRLLAAWCPVFSTDIATKHSKSTYLSGLALIRNESGRSWVLAADRRAQALGVDPGLPLADALAREPRLGVVPADVAGDARRLEKLADWCLRYTPWVGIDGTVGPGEAGLMLDVTGCAHLHGGEPGLVASLGRRLDGFGLEHRLAIADTPGAAWAWARFGPPQRPRLPPGRIAEALATLPVEGLRLPAGTVETLKRLGLRRIADIAALPRAALAARFEPILLRRLDQALGRADEPIAPRRPPVAWSERRDCAEPLMVPDGVALLFARLAAALCRRLERAGLGARRLAFTAYRVDGSIGAVGIGTSHPTRDAAHLARLFAPKLETLDPDPGIETLVLDAAVVEPLTANQAAMIRGEAPARTDTGAALAPLIDRLANRLGAGRVVYLAPRATPVPEAQTLRLPAQAHRPPDWSAWPRHDTPRAAGQPAAPLRLFERPERIEGLLPANDPAAGTPPAPERPPLRFLWRHRAYATARALGPDRRLGPWWLQDDSRRDYWIIDTACGLRLWLYRDLSFPEGAEGGAWFAHGVLAPAIAPPER